MTTLEQTPSPSKRIVSGADSASERLAALYAEFDGNADFTIVAQTPRDGGPAGSYAFAVQKTGEVFQILFTCDGGPVAPGDNIFVQVAPTGGITNAADTMNLSNISPQVGPIPAASGALALEMGVSVDPDCVNILFLSPARDAVPYMIRAGRIYNPLLDLDDLTGLGVLAGIPRVSPDVVNQAGQILSVNTASISRAFHLGGSSWTSEVTTDMSWEQVSREVTQTTGSSAHAAPIVIKRRLQISGPLDTWMSLGGLTGLRVVPGAVGNEGHATLSRAPRSNGGSYLILSPDPSGPAPHHEKLGLPWGDLDLAA